MDVDVEPAPVVKSKGKAKDDGKDGKKRFEVKKVRLFIILIVQWLLIMIRLSIRQCYDPTSGML